jgi:hypothetical protein
MSVNCKLNAGCPGPAIMDRCACCPPVQAPTLEYTIVRPIHSMAQFPSQASSETRRSNCEYCLSRFVVFKQARDVVSRIRIRKRLLTQPHRPAAPLPQSPCGAFCFLPSACRLLSCAFLPYCLSAFLPQALICQAGLERDVRRPPDRCPSLARPACHTLERPGVRMTV